MIVHQKTLRLKYIRVRVPLGERLITPQLNLMLLLPPRPLR